jgi:hypothetical protein
MGYHADTDGFEQSDLPSAPELANPSEDHALKSQKLPVQPEECDLSREKRVFFRSRALSSTFTEADITRWLHDSGGVGRKRSVNRFPNVDVYDEEVGTVIYSLNGAPIRSYGVLRLRVGGWKVPRDSILRSGERNGVWGEVDHLAIGELAIINRYNQLALSKEAVAVPLRDIDEVKSE